jgi:PAS domain S-box-containing protein
MDSSQPAGADRRSADRLAIAQGRRTVEARILHHVSSLINSTLHLDRIYEIVLTTMDELFGFRHSLILLLDDGGDTLTVVASRGYDHPPAGVKVTVGTGLIGVVAKRRRTMRLSNLGQQRAYAETIRKEMKREGMEDDLQQIPELPGLRNAESQIAIPLLIQDRLIGVFSVESEARQVFDEEDEVLMSIVANQAASAIQNARLFQAEADRRKELAEHNLALVRLARSQSLAVDYQEGFLRDVTETVAETVHVERASIWAYAQDRGSIQLLDLYDRRSGEHSAGAELAAADYPAYFRSLAAERVIAAHDAHHDPRTADFSATYLTPLGISSMLDAPIHVAGEMIGVICLENVGPSRRWTPEEEAFSASVADLVTIAIEGTRRRRALEALRASEQRYRALAENFPNGVVLLFDQDLRYTLADGKGLVEVGLARDGLEGKTIWEALPPETAAEIEPIYRRALAGEASVSEVVFARRLFEVHVLPVRDADGHVLAGMVMTQDITERKEAERLLEEKVETRTRELRENQAQLVQSGKMAALGSLAAGLAHEINTPLGAMVGNSDIATRLVQRMKNLLTDANQAPAARRRADLVELADSIEEIEAMSRAAGARITRIVSSLKDFAHLDQAVEEEVDLHAGIDSTLALVQHLLRDHITVKREFGDIPRIRCSPGQVNQVFMNLILNAIQAVEGSGTITIRTGVEGGSVVVEVIDDGVGIPAEHLQRIFDPGFTTKGVKVGTGLGLAIAFRVVENHGGRIEVESMPGQGSTFRILLPMAARSE